MIRNAILTLCMLVSLCGWACDKTDSSGLVFDKTVHDFGQVSVSAGYITCRYTCVNTADSAIYILGALSGCGCAVPTYPREAILPGKSATVQVTYDTLGRPDGEFEKEIVLHTTGPQPSITLRLRGNAVK